MSVCLDVHFSQRQQGGTTAAPAGAGELVAAANPPTVADFVKRTVSEWLRLLYIQASLCLLSLACLFSLPMLFPCWQGGVKGNSVADVVLWEKGQSLSSAMSFKDHSDPATIIHAFLIYLLEAADNCQRGAVICQLLRA
jgi:hypothetical protein